MPFLIIHIEKQLKLFPITTLLIFDLNHGVDLFHDKTVLNIYSILKKQQTTKYYYII